MKRNNLLPKLDQKVRFEYAKVEDFSMQKGNGMFAGKVIFNPTILLTNLQTRINQRTTHVNHMWIIASLNVLEKNLHIGDTISFTARIMKYEKMDANSNLMITDVGFDFIQNINVISSETNGKSLYQYFRKCLYRNDVIISDKYLNWIYKNITTQENCKSVIKN